MNIRNGIALLLALACLGTPLMAQENLEGVLEVPLPEAIGPVPVTADSYPLMADARLQHPVDLPALGYVEEEYFVSSRANVYDWTENGVSVRTRNAPYTTRILVRRPADPSRSSGSAYVELGNSARGFDWGFSWSLAWRQMTRNGDTWVGVTYSGDAIEALRQFSPGRYASLGFPNPDPAPCGRGGAVPASEDGLRFDMLSQVAVLIRSMDGWGIGRVYAMSHGSELPTYIQAVHPRSVGPDGGPLYDGFILHRHNRLGSLNACGGAPAPDDPRHVIRDAGVPVIRIVAETDAASTVGLRREDSDTPGDQYRLYEVAGAPHADGAFYRHLPLLEDQEAVGTQPFLSYWPFASQCEPEIPIQDFSLMSDVVDAAIQNLDTWVRGGAPAPRAERIALDDAGNVATDEVGNAAGGVPSVYLEVPTARYFTHAGGPGTCRNLGYSEPFDWPQLEETYGDYAAYAARREGVIDQLLAERWLTGDDARSLRDRPPAP